MACVILGLVIFVGLQLVTDGQTHEDSIYRTSIASRGNKSLSAAPAWLIAQCFFSTYRLGGIFPSKVSSFPPKIDQNSHHSVIHFKFNSSFSCINMSSAMVFLFHAHGPDKLSQKDLCKMAYLWYDQKLRSIQLPHTAQWTQFINNLLLSPLKFSVFLVSIVVLISIIIISQRGPSLLENIFFLFSGPASRLYGLSIDLALRVLLGLGQLSRQDSH